VLDDFADLRDADRLVSLAACAQTTRVDDAALATGSTARTKKGIALVKVGAAINACTTASVTPGVRDGVVPRHHHIARRRAGIP
jgi:hypothetical protein